MSTYEAEIDYIEVAEYDSSGNPLEIDLYSNNVNVAKIFITYDTTTGQPCSVTSFNATKKGAVESTRRV